MIGWGIGFFIPLIVGRQNDGVSARLLYRGPFLRPMSFIGTGNSFSLHLFLTAASQCLANSEEFI